MANEANRWVVVCAALAIGSIRSIGSTGSMGCGPRLDADGKPATLGRLRLRTFPKGAQVWVDGKLEVVHTPATLLLSQGEHHLRIQARGATATERTVSVTPGTSKEMNIRIPSPPPARIHVFADVIGADVRINGYRRGSTPLLGAVTKPGPVDVTVSIGNQARSERTSLTIGEQKTIEVFFGPEPQRVGPGVCPVPERLCRPAPKGRLTLGMKPEGRVFTASGSDLGPTPLVRHPMEPGEHTLILRSKDRRYERRITLNIAAGETSIFRFRLTDDDIVPGLSAASKPALDAGSSAPRPNAALSLAALEPPRYPAPVEVAELVIQKNEQNLLHLRLTQAETYIGRMASNDVVLPDDQVPEVAAVLIDRGAHRFVLRDASDGALKVGGTVLDGAEVDLTDGAVLDLGPYRMRLKVRAAKSFDRGGQTSTLGNDADGSWQANLRFGDKVIALSGSRPFNIGSDDDNDLVLTDTFVSGFHCRISNRRGRWVLSDLESTNGTKVNGLKVHEAELPMPATIEIGKATLVLEPPPPPSPKSPTVFHGMIAASRSMRQIFGLIGRFADADEPVLVYGESGSGKELVARALHDGSKRAEGPYLALNCGALNSQLIESELFGHVKGAFTGALRDKIGAFEATTGGTLFLDEIGELPLDLQPKLLRVLETSSVRAVGGTKEVPIQTRVIAATHRNLEQMVDEGSFREDLFHRLFVLSLSIPPLQQRPEDVVALAQHFLQAQAPRPIRLSADAQKALENYDWPGNVRELRNVIVRAILMTDADTIRAGDLRFTKDAFMRPMRDARRTLRNKDASERDRIVSTLEAVNGNKTEAARVLRMSKSTFYDRLRRYGIAIRDSGD